MSTFSPTNTDLITERLALRPWPAEDVAAVLSGDRMEHWAPDFPAEGDQVIAGVIAGQGEEPDEYSHRLVIERASGSVVGSISLLWPPNDGALEFGYGIVASRRGRGYAPEAARSLVAFALASPEVHTVYADVELSNPASIRVLEKAGLKRRSEDGNVARFSTTAADPR